MKNLEKILAEIYELDESLKGHDEDLKKIVSRMIENKPDTQFDEDFKEELRMKLSTKIAELKEEGPKKIGIFNYIFNFGTIKYVGAFVTVLTIALLAPFLYKAYKPDVTIQPIKEMSIPTNLQAPKKEIKKSTKTDTTLKTDTNNERGNVEDGHVRPDDEGIDKKPTDKTAHTTDAPLKTKKTDVPPTVETTDQKSNLGASSSSSSSSSGGDVPVSISAPSMAVPMQTGVESTSLMTDLGYGFKKDNKNVYYKEVLIKNADPITFKVLNGNYSKDKNNVYYLGNVIKNADSASFEATDQLTAKDKNNVYYMGEVKNDK